jgi:hypothetical protein
MVFYHLSGAQILRIFRKPTRREEGIAPQTVAAMQARKPANSKSQMANGSNRSEEIWIMYKLNKRANDLQPTAVGSKLSSSRITMISAWRYPGVTKPGERPSIPEDVAEMLERGIY